MRRRMESRLRLQRGRFFVPSPNGGPKSCPTIVLANLAHGRPSRRPLAAAAMTREFACLGD